MSRGLVLLSAVLLFALVPGLHHQAAAAPAPSTLEARPDAGAAIGNPDPQPAPPAADLRGLHRDTWYFLGYQFVAVGVLYVMPQDVTNFDRSGDHLKKWRYNVTHPTWDEDDDYINYILHPYWGATYYIRGRERGLGRWESFGYSTLLSTLYEYGAEALFERPSYQDLFVTPVVGSLLGEFVFSPMRDHIRSKPGPLGGTDKFLLILTDPLGAANDLTNRLFGVETQVSLTPFRGMSSPRRASGPFGSVHAGGSVAGPRPDHPRPRSPTWGLQLDVRW